MVDPELTNAVGDLLDGIAAEPTRLPLAEVAAVHARGHDIEIDRRGAAPVVYVSPRPALPLDELSVREREVALLVSGGYTNQQVAATLFISVATVKDHMHAILRKTGFESRAQLIAAWYGGLADGPVPGA